MNVENVTELPLGIRQMMHRILKYCLVLGVAVIGWEAAAGEADVLKVRVLKERNSFGFAVTVRHVDDGWKHYANR